MAAVQATREQAVPSARASCAPSIGSTSSSSSCLAGSDLFCWLLPEKKNGTVRIGFSSVRILFLACILSSVEFAVRGFDLCQLEVETIRPWIDLGVGRRLSVFEFGAPWCFRPEHLVDGLVRYILCTSTS